MVFDEDLMLREKSEKQTLRKRELSSQVALKDLKGQKRTPQIQMETNRRLLKSNINR